MFYIVFKISGNSIENFLVGNIILQLSLNNRVANCILNNIIDISNLHAGGNIFFFNSFYFKQN